MRKGPLCGIKVLELGDNMSAPFCGKLLADFGAEVVKAERPGVGDQSRRHGPFPKDIPHLERSGLYQFLNTNKYGITLDVENPAGRKIFLNLLRDCDILVENNSAKHMDDIGFSYGQLKKQFAQLIMVSITIFGNTGQYRDYKAYDINCLAAGGMSHGEGYPDREPLAFPLSQGGYLGGVCGAIGALLAVFSRESTNEGQHVDISSAECFATFLAGIAMQSFVSEGRIRPRSGHRVPLAPNLDAVLPCKDGYVIIDTPQRRQWKRLLDVLGNPEWAQDPKLERGIGIMDEYGDEIESNLAPWLMSHSKAEIFDICRKYQIPAAPIADIEEVVKSEQLNGRGFFVDVECKDAGTLTLPGAPVKFFKTPWSIRMSAPRLGEHNELIYCDRLGYTRTELKQLDQTGVI